MLKMWKIVKTKMTFLMTQVHSLKTHLFRETIKYLFYWYLHVWKGRSSCLLLSPFFINSMLTTHTYVERKIWITNYSSFSKFSYPLAQPLNFSLPPPPHSSTPYIQFIDIELKSLEKVNISQDSQNHLPNQTFDFEKIKYLLFIFT